MGPRRVLEAEVAHKGELRTPIAERIIGNLEGLELREVITELADDLFDCPQWRIGMDAKSEDFDKRIWEKYPGY